MSHANKVDSFISSVERTRKLIGKDKSVQVRKTELKTICKVLAMTWFREVRPSTDGEISRHVQSLDDHFRTLSEFTARSTLRSKYLENLKGIMKGLVALRSAILVEPSSITPVQTSCPDFSSLIRDPRMQSILARRWNEVRACIDAGAHLAASVMMGSMLEGLLLSRVTRLTDPSALFRTRSCPKDSKTGKALPWQKWTLNDFINVAHEMGWIGKSAKDVSVAMRDYRNFIHPAKELSEGIDLTPTDTDVLFTVFNALVNQIIVIDAS